jgi:hypothetical protein
MLEGFSPDRLAAVTKARKRAVCSLTSIGSSQWVGPKKTRRVAQQNRFFALIGLCRSRLAHAIGEVRDRGTLRDEFARLRNTGRLDRVLDEVLLDPAQLSILIENNPGSARRMTGDAAPLTHRGEAGGAQQCGCTSHPDLLALRRTGEM